MADTTSSSESLALALLTDIVRLILATLRLAALILENSAQILNLSMQHVASAPPSNEKAGTQRSVTLEASQSDNVYTGAMPLSPGLSTFAVADPESPVAQKGHEKSCQHTLFRPLPLFCDPKTLSRRFYCVTVGRQVGVFDSSVEAEEYTIYVKGAICKGYGTRQEAIDVFLAAHNRGTTHVIGG
ncbi:hypothetical protein PILCRDRAFT_6743 [Piloderma croceum F 1598]|uniref:Ribonuclease H1 N-terminal domain-containing protein n=1 Tax=Piloderma croceum (strain F 1598) TaxID=765440 RepID=A0A0C3C2Q5_PILCF|nr:hypothetical protein PILCRDRAFT_6743 [Piloderma croceum F 1598]